MNNFDLLSKDILIELAIELNLPDIVNWCSLNKKFDNLTCKNDIFWRRKFIHDYGEYPKNSDLTWREFYKFITVAKPNDLLWKGVEENVLSYVVVALKRGADINRRRNYDSPLSTASKYGYLEVVKYLVEQGSYVRVSNDEALRFASFNGHLEIVKYLVEQGADVRADNNYALRSASIKGHLEVVKYLVEQGANVHARNDEALFWAKRNEHFEVVKYLESLP